MTINMSKINNIHNIPQSTQNTKGPSVQNKAQIPSFGIKPIVLDDEGFRAKFLSKTGTEFNSAMQRGLMGVTAIVTQPFIDSRNKAVDEKTRDISKKRTAAKIIVGTATGVTVRGVCIWLMKHFTQNQNILDYENGMTKALKKGKALKKLPIDPKKLKRAQALLPKHFKDIATARQIKKYRGAVGTLLGLVVMMYTNFHVDAPLTTLLTNAFIGKDNKGGN